MVFEWVCVCSTHVLTRTRACVHGGGEHTCHSVHMEIKGQLWSWSLEATVCKPAPHLTGLVGQVEGLPVLQDHLRLSGLQATLKQLVRCSWFLDENSCQLIEICCRDTYRLGTAGISTTIVCSLQCRKQQLEGDCKQLEQTHAYESW